MNHTTAVRTRNLRHVKFAAIIAFLAMIGILLYQLASGSSFAGLSKNGDDLGPDSTAANGALPSRVLVIDEKYAGIANLDPALRRALRDVADDGIDFYINSGWRSRAYQEQLFREAVAQYGSEDEAARWVAAPATSAHVSGNAVDIKPSDATTWLSEHGTTCSLCQIYRNEPWHFELRPDAAVQGCPRMYADAAHDPRMQ